MRALAEVLEQEEKKKKTTKTSSTKSKTTKSRTTRRKKTEEGEEDAPKKSTTDIIVDRLIARIESDNQMPWQKPFISACMNWYTNREYNGINRFLLSGGEYITKTQLNEYNKKNNTTFRFQKGIPFDFCVFFTNSERKVTQEQVDEMQKKSDRKLRIIEKDGQLYLQRMVLKYYRVYNIAWIKDEEGNSLPPKLGNGFVEEYVPAEDIINNYRFGTGVNIAHGSGGASYMESMDVVKLPQMNYFADTESYYRVLFHELVHSTGIKSRLNRPCYALYHKEIKEGRGKEEFVAEMGAVLLASEAGFKNETNEYGSHKDWDDNSLTYIAGWCHWMKNNKSEVVNAMFMTEKAKKYILNGGTLPDYNEHDTDDAIKPVQRKA